MCAPFWKHGPCRRSSACANVQHTLETFFGPCAGRSMQLGLHCQSCAPRTIPFHRCGNDGRLCVRPRHVEHPVIVPAVSGFLAALIPRMRRDCRRHRHDRYVTALASCVAPVRQTLKVGDLGRLETLRAIRNTMFFSVFCMDIFAPCKVFCQEAQSCSLECEVEPFLEVPAEIRERDEAFSYVLDVWSRWDPPKDAEYYDLRKYPEADQGSFSGAGGASTFLHDAHLLRHTGDTNALVDTWTRTHQFSSTRSRDTRGSIQIQRNWARTHAQTRSHPETTSIVATSSTAEEETNDPNICVFAETKRLVDEAKRKQLYQ